MHTLIQQIGEACNTPISGFAKLGGGDTSEAYRVQSGADKYFLKLNPGMADQRFFEREAAGLNALRLCTSLQVPIVVSYGNITDCQYLLLEWLERGKPADDCWEQFGSRLAQMHAQEQPYFGWLENNFIGRLAQLNHPVNAWHVFLAESRLMPLVHQLQERGDFTTSEVMLAENCCAKLKSIFPPECPALLHGDLWAGNYMVTQTGYAAIYDPSVYFGHREMDIAMTRLFGGFPTAFYDAYHSNYPLEQGWEQRLKLCQLYPLLVHALLFGANYTREVKEIIKYYAG